MDGLAKQLDVSGANLFAAEVKSLLEGRYLLVDPYGRVVKAKRAVSCLIEPEAGDRVLAATTGKSSFLLAVLERQRTTASTLSLEGDVKMSVPSGKLDIIAKEGMTLGTPEELSLIADTLGISGKALAAAFQKIDLFGAAVEAHLTDIKLVSKRLHSRVESAMQQFIRRHAKVEGIDSVNAGTIKQTAKELLNLRSMFTFMKAKKNVKIDGKQIFMG